MATPHHNEWAIQVRAVHKHFGQVHAVQGVSLDIPRGEVLGLIGHNGAGKSTLFKMMLGLIPSCQGDILIRGEPVLGPRFREVRRHIGYLPEHVNLYDHLSGLETLQYFARLKQIDVAHCGPALESVGLSHAADRAVQTYSKGMRQRLGFAQALLGQPQVLFLDEPTTGMDPEAVRAFYASLQTLRQSGVTMILTSHILAELQHRVDRIAVMSDGKLQALGSLHDLREAADMPLTIHVQCPVDHVPHVMARLSPLPGMVEPPHVRPEGGLVLRIVRAQKVPLLKVLMTQPDGVIDVQVEEPTLEDLFFKGAA